MKKFGANDKRMTLGAKYGPAVDNNPPPGWYNVEAAEPHVRPKNNVRGFHGVRKDPKKDETPAPGHYDGHLKKFGENSKRMTLGTKFGAPVNNNPPPGAYNIDAAAPYVSARSNVGGFHGVRKEPKKDETPAPGHYDGHLKKFG